MQINLKKATDDDLKCRSLELLAFGILPYQNWSSSFANPRQNGFPGLQARAFCVWFPTMIDFIKGKTEVEAIKTETENRNIDCEPVLQLWFELYECFLNVLLLYSVEEQLFIRDRRLQNVHGKLALNTFEEHNIELFDSASKSIQKKTFTPEEYRKINTVFYFNLSEVSSELIQRLLDSEEFINLTNLYVNKLKMETHFYPMIKKLGVSAAAGSG